MIRTRSANLVACIACGFASFAAEITALGADLLIDSSTIILFSTLDGSSDDEDGTADGTLTLCSLTVTASGQIVIDVPSATFAVSGPVSLDGSASISTDGTDLPATGPTLVIDTDDSITLAGSSRIVADGAEVGGAVFLCAGQRIELCGTTSTIAAGGLGAGGSIHLEAAEVIRMLSGASNISANGLEGGTITMVACGVNGETVPPTCGGDDEIDEDDFEDGSVAAALWINGHVEATGSDGVGGTIDLFARQGSIKLSRKRNRLLASGSAGDGSITLTAATFVDPSAPTTTPPLQMITDSPSTEECGCPVGGPLTAILDEHPQVTNVSPVTITGSAFGAATVEISGPLGVFETTVEGGLFTAEVPLEPNHVNQWFFTPIDAGGDRGVPTATTITHDAQSPSLFIDFPSDEIELTTDVTDVAGRVSDVLSGFMGLTVTVNGVMAVVDVGIGSNGTFFAGAVPLAVGNNTITAVATDELGNTTEKQITIERVEIPPDTPRMFVLSGNGQTGPVGSALPEPIVVKVFKADGTTPFVNKIVTFDVTRSNGRLTAALPVGDEQGSMMLQVHTDADGEAKAFWRLGFDAGCGNNRVAATSASIAGSVFFCASSTPGPASQINIGSGNNQRAEAGGPAPEPLRVWVNDACNGISGIPVTFTVRRGGGEVNGEDFVTVVTSDTGHAQVDFVLGPDPGNNEIEANFPDNPLMGAFFVVTAVLRDEALSTSFSTLVLDNGNRPIEGAECSLTIGTDAPLMSNTDAGGRCGFDEIAGAGPAEFHVDGLVATAVNGEPVPPGSFPALSFGVVIIPNAQNTLPTPVLLPPLDPDNAVEFDNTQDVQLTVKGIDGLTMLVKAGSMTRADGTVPSPADPAIIALNQVHFDDVPMPIPDGAAPPFAWTLQPAGAMFDPPIEITYPNMSGLPAGSIAYFLSFNHDTMRFEIVATGQVTDDGSKIVSDPGAGISVAGWGCNCPPYAVTGDCCKCDECETCNCGQCDVACPSGDCPSSTPPLRCCAGPCTYDPTTHGCCVLAGACSIYNLATQCCTPAPGGGFAVVAKSPIHWSDPTFCPDRVPNPLWTFMYDGCTNWFDSYTCLATFNTFFWTNAARTGPCNEHDRCYQTCHNPDAGARAACDAAIEANMQAVCNAYIPPPGTSPCLVANCIAACFGEAALIRFGLELFGGGAFRDRQREVCNCCP